MTSHHSTQCVDDGELKTLLQQLQKSFKVVEQCVQSWSDILANCQVHVETLNNLTEQFTLCNGTTDEQLAAITARLPDIKDKLLYKLQQEVDVKLVILQEKLCALHGLCDRVTKQCKYSTDVYLGNQTKLDLVTVTMTTATHPSIADMLEWLQDAEQIFLQRYWERKYVLDQFRLTEKSSHLSNSSIWCGVDKDIHKQIQEKLAYLSFFLDEKL